MTTIRIILLVLFIPFLFTTCQKGEPIDFQDYIKISVSVFCEDTSLYVTGSFEDSTFYADASQRDGGSVFPLYINPPQFLRPKEDSGRLKITVIKKNNPNLQFDSLIKVSNYNELLLVELDPLQRPYLIDLRTAADSVNKPAADSIKVRFYFSSKDANITNNNYSPARAVKALDLELWTLRDGDGDGIGEPVNINRKFRVNADQLNNKYFSLGKNDSYAWRLLDVSPGVASNKRVIETFEYDPGFGVFTRGFIDVHTDSPFQTFKITQTFETLYSYQYGINGKFLFGLQ